MAEQTQEYIAVAKVDELSPGEMLEVDLMGEEVALFNVEGEFYAIRNRCGDSPLPLQFGRLEGSELVCSWHGCRWDVRSGRRGDGSDERLAVFPVHVDGGVIEVALGVEPVPTG